MKKTDKKEIFRNFRDKYKTKVPLSLWFVGYFVGIKKELTRTRWIKGKKLATSLWSVLLIVLVFALILFGINLLIFEVFAEIGV